MPTEELLTDEVIDVEVPEETVAPSWAGT